MAELNDKKYLDYAGLSHFWSKTKTYIDAGDQKVADDAAAALGTAVEAINGSIDDINEKLEALSVNGQTFDAEGKIVLGASDIEYAAAITGENATPAVSVADAITTNAEAIAALESSTITSVDAETAFEEGHENDILVALSSETTEGAVKITLDETALQEKLETIEAAAGVATLNAKGQNGSADVGSSLIAVGITNADKKAEADGSYKGNVTITIDENALHAKFGEVDGAIEANAAAIAANAEAIEANAEAIAGLVISVDKATEGNNEDYVSLGVNTTDNEVTLTLNDSALSEKFTEVDSDITYLKGLTINGKAAYTTGADSSKVNAVTISAGDIEYTAAGEGTDAVSVADAIAANADAIAALASATHFIGVTTTKVTDGGTEKVIIGGAEHNAQDGDIVIYEQGEFIWSNGAWHLLGDTTAESARITALETWVNTKVISNSEIDDLFTEGGTTPEPEQ